MSTPNSESLNTCSAHVNNANNASESTPVLNMISTSTTQTLTYENKASRRIQ